MRPVNWWWVGSPGGMEYEPKRPGGGGDYQHHWYKMMYRKLHQPDHDRGPSIAHRARIKANCLHFGPLIWAGLVG